MTKEFLNKNILLILNFIFLITLIALAIILSKALKKEVVAYKQSLANNLAIGDLQHAIAEIEKKLQVNEDEITKKKDDE